MKVGWRARAGMLVRGGDCSVVEVYTCGEWKFTRVQSKGTIVDCTNTWIAHLHGLHV